MAEFYHHGVKGQKWGVRRYRNADGSLTSAGKKRAAQNRKKPDAYVIRKGTDFYRLSSTKDEDLKKRIYATPSTVDKRLYDELFDNLWGYDPDKMYNHVYTLTKDIKVAKGREVTDYIVKKYGDVRIKDIYKTERKVNYDNMTLDEKWSYYDNHGVYNTDYKDYKKFIRETMKKKSINDDVVKEFAKRGYDAIMDPEDYMSLEKPMILLNPHKSVKKKSTTPFYTHQED